MTGYEILGWLLPFIPLLGLVKFFYDMAKYNKDEERRKVWRALKHGIE